MAISIVKYSDIIFADTIKSANFFVNKKELENWRPFMYINRYLKDLDCGFLVIEEYYISATYRQEIEYYYWSEFKNIRKIIL